MGSGSGESGGFVHEFSIQGIGSEHLSDIRDGRCCTAGVGLDHFPTSRYGPNCLDLEVSRWEVGCNLASDGLNDSIGSHWCSSSL